MEVFLSEHGQTIQYAVIGVIIVALISIITNTSIKKIMPAYNCESVLVISVVLRLHLICLPVRSSDGLY